MSPVVTRRGALSEMQEILKSLVAAPVDGGELGQESGPTPYHPDPALKTHPMLPMQFHSFDRSVPVHYIIYYSTTTGRKIESVQPDTPINRFFQPLLTCIQMHTSVVLLVKYLDITFGKTVDAGID